MKEENNSNRLKKLQVGITELKIGYDIYAAYMAKSSHQLDKKKICGVFMNEALSRQ